MGRFRLPSYGSSLAHFRRIVAQHSAVSTVPKPDIRDSQKADAQLARSIESDPVDHVDAGDMLKPFASRKIN